MQYSDIFAKPEDLKVFQAPTKKSEVVDNGTYMNLFGDESEVIVVSQTPAQYDLFGEQKSEQKKPAFDALFGNTENVKSTLAKPISNVNRTVYDLTFNDNVKKIKQHEASVRPASTNLIHVDLSFPTYDVKTVGEKFKKFVAENEILTNSMIDLTQEMQTEHEKIEKKYSVISGIVNEIKDALTVKYTWLKKEIPIDTSRVNRLIDEAQKAAKDKFKVDPFLMTNLQHVTSRSGECFRIIEHLETCVKASIADGTITSDDPLYTRIITTRKLMELQKISTEKTLKLLTASYDKIEDFRQNTLVIILIEAQNKLI